MTSSSHTILIWHLLPLPHLSVTPVTSALSFYDITSSGFTRKQEYNTCWSLWKGPTEGQTTDPLEGPQFASLNSLSPYADHKEGPALPCPMSDKFTTLSL